MGEGCTHYSSIVGVQRSGICNCRNCSRLKLLWYGAGAFRSRQISQVHTVSIKHLLAPLTTVATAIGVNAIPAFGMLAAGWQAETAMLLYLFETLVVIVLVALRIHLLAPPYEVTQGRGVVRRTPLIKHFLLFTLGFTGVVSVFTLLFIGMGSGGEPNLVAVRTGALLILLILFGGFVVDLLLPRPSSLTECEAWINGAIGRVALLYFAVFIGVFVALIDVAWFFAPFVRCSR
jgi:hypothetical protein